MNHALEYLQRYAIGFAIALGLHIAIVAALQLTLDTLTAQSSKFVIEPKPLQAKLIRLPPQRVAPEPTSSPAIPDKPADTDEAEETSTEESKLEQLERLMREREERLAELRNRAFEDAVGEEMTAEMADAIQEVSQIYINGIYLAVVESWSRPPSARTGMEAVVLVELLPTGELNSVGIVESSGHSPFDRSTLNAVRRAAPFIVPDDPALFESSFRSFTLNFRPEDLLR